MRQQILAPPGQQPRQMLRTQLAATNVCSSPVLDRVSTHSGLLASKCGPGNVGAGCGCGSHVTPRCGRAKRKHKRFRAPSPGKEPRPSNSHKTYYGTLSRGLGTVRRGPARRPMPGRRFGERNSYLAILCLHVHISIQKYLFESDYYAGFRKRDHEWFKLEFAFHRIPARPGAAAIRARRRSPDPYACW